MIDVDAVMDDCLRICRTVAGVSDGGGELRAEAWVPGRHRQNRVRRFVTVSIGDRPRFIAKVPEAADDTKVAAELAKLQAIAGSGVPLSRPIAALRSGFVMDYVGTADLPDVFLRLSAAERMRTVCRVVDELARFHRSHRELAAPPADAWAGDVIDPALLTNAPTGPTHGDFGPWNIRVSADDLWFIDWEDYKPGLLANDVLNFVFTLPVVMYPECRDFDALYDLTFHTENEMRALAVAALTRYGRALQTSARDIALLLPYFCAYQIRRFEAEGRSAAHLFYGPFLRRWRGDHIGWIENLDD